MKVVKTDTLFEAALGLVLVVGAAAGALDGSDFPGPVGTAVIVVVGCALLVVAVVLWHGGVSLLALAAANLATALAAAIWCAVATGFSTAGAAVVSATAAALACLAVAQLVVRARLRR